MTDEMQNCAEDDPAAIVPERALQHASEAHHYPVDALREAVREDLERNRWMAAEIREQRPLAYECGDYEVYIANPAVTTETPLAVLAVYEEMDKSDASYQNGYALVVPRGDTANRR
jgi:Arc/MetJ-type ribon-helix-helix transcriptional regulator